MTNKEAFEKLCETYSKIKISQLREQKELIPIYMGGYLGSEIMERITGFGYSNSCSLCKSVSRSCDQCLWYGTNIKPYHSCINSNYHKIEFAKNIASLLRALRFRARLMRRILSRVEHNEK